MTIQEATEAIKGLQKTLRERISKALFLEQKQVCEVLSLVQSHQKELDDRHKEDQVIADADRAMLLEANAETARLRKVEVDDVRHKDTLVYARNEVVRLLGIVEESERKLQLADKQRRRHEEYSAKQRLKIRFMETEFARLLSAFKEDIRTQHDRFTPF